jgi:hypothetical protein
MGPARLIVKQGTSDRLPLFHKASTAPLDDQVDVTIQWTLA